MKQIITGDFKKQLPEILKYHKVLCQLYRHPVSLEQAITDWHEKGYDSKFLDEK